MIRQLRWKFVGISMALVTLVMVALIVVVLLTTRASLYSDSITALHQALTLSADTFEPEPEDDAGLFGTEKVQLPYLTVQVRVRSDQVVVLGNQFFDLQDETALNAVLNAALSGESTGTVRAYGYSLRYLREENLFGWRIAFVDLTQEFSTLTSLATNLILIGLGALAAFFLISLLLARWAVRPVERSWKQQRQFVSDASHELKTPLTVILSSLDMLEEYGGDEENRQRWLENIRAASGQMKTLVEEMLVLARSDNATQQLNLQLLDFGELAEGELLLFEPIAFEQGKTMEEYLAPGAFVCGDAGLLRRIVDIYLDNACKYSPSGSVIRVTLQGENKRIVLAVYSAGDPIPQEQLDRLFERFYRADSSRSEEGYGLGLAIAQELARQHHGKVWAESSRIGNTFFLTLPRAKGGEAPPSERPALP